MIVGKKKFNYGEVTTEPIYEGLAVAANGWDLCRWRLESTNFQ